MTTAKLFLDAIGEDSDNTLLEEVGTLVFQSAIMYYLAAHNENEVNIFESYVNQNVAEVSFIDDLCAEFPDFKNILLTEMRAFENDLNVA